MGNVATWLQTNWEYIAALAGGLHVILNVLGKITGNKAIEGLDNAIMSLLAAFGIKPGVKEAPKA